MPDGQVLEFTHVTKRFNEVTAVSDFSARIEPGAVTAFLGPNGAGKTTTLRILLGQIRASSGTATIGGSAYAELRQPLRAIGSVLEDAAYRPRRTATRQLTIAAKANGIAPSRVDEVLRLVGLAGDADSRIGGFSLGMRQRLSVAHALLGDPGALVFDEPANGLDPEGIRWMRLLMRRLADEGRTVLVSSHVLSEVEQVADHVLVLSKGHLVLDSGIEKLADPNAGSVVVDAADRAALAAALTGAGFDLEVLRSGLTVRGGDAAKVGAVAASAGIALTTLVQRGPTLEDVFIELVRGGKLEARAELAASQLVGSDNGSAFAPVPVAPADGAADAEGDSDDDGDSDADGDQVGESSAGSEAATAPSAEGISAELRRSVPAAGLAAGSAASSETEGGDSDDAAPAPSFDEILFGGPAPASGPITSAADEDTTVAHDVAAIFAAPEDEDENPAPDEVAAPEADPVNSDEVAASDSGDGDHGDGDDDGRDGENGDDHTGVEVFAGLQDEAQTDEDPRSAAVSSMLAAAARAYYEDEPRDYPGATTSETDADADADADGGAQWSVASTGVIDTVPAAADSEPTDAEHHEHGEHHDG